MFLIFIWSFIIKFHHTQKSTWTMIILQFSKMCHIRLSLTNTCFPEFQFNNDISKSKVNVSRTVLYLVRLKLFWTLVKYSNVKVCSFLWHSVYNVTSQTCLYQNLLIVTSMTSPCDAILWIFRCMVQFTILYIERYSI